MPITDNATSTTFAGPQAPQMQFGGMPSGGMPGFNLPMYQPQTSGQDLMKTPQNFKGIEGLITHQPQSMTNTLMPGLMQILGLQTSSMMPMFQNQTNQMTSSAQSDAMKRGMTGSSIEAASMLGARQAGNYNMNQFMGQQLGQLGTAYQGAIGQDVNSQNQMYQNLAQAIGQKMAQDQAYSMFMQQMDQQRDLSAQAGKNAMWSAGIGALGMGGAGALAHYSDEILKTDIRKVDEIGGLGLYEFEYRKDLNLKLPLGKRLGFMAQEVAKKLPQFVSKINGFMAVDYMGLTQALGA